MAEKRRGCTGGWGNTEEERDLTGSQALLYQQEAAGAGMAARVPPPHQASPRPAHCPGPWEDPMHGPHYSAHHPAIEISFNLAASPLG